MPNNKPPVSVYKGSGFYRGDRWFNCGQLSTIVSCNLDLPTDQPCEFVTVALSQENAETLVYAHLRTCHPEAVRDQIWSETVGRLRVGKT